MQWAPRATALAALMIFTSTASAGDILITKDGRIFETAKMVRTKDGIEVTFQNGTVPVPTRMIQDAVLAADAQMPPATPEEKEKAEKGLVRYDGKWVPLKRRDELVAKKLDEKRKVLEEIQAHSEWGQRYIEETKAFRYEYTIPPHVFAEYRDAMEAYYAQFVKAWKITPPRGEPKLPVNIYRDATSYRQVSGSPAGALAYFRFVKPWDLNTYYDRLDNEYSKHVLYHEANHYLQLLVDTTFAVPHFPGESMAEYYGAARWDPVTKKFETGLIQEGRLCEIQSDIAGGEKISLEKLITTEGMYQHYNWGWSLVHFLMNDARYATKFQKFFLALSGGKGIQRQDMGRDNLRTMKQADVWPVFLSELGLKDAAAIRKLETEWYDSIDKLGLVNATGLAKAGFSAADEGRVIRARRFLKESIEKGTQNPLVFERYSQLLDMNGDAGLAKEMLAKAIEIDPLEGKFYNTLGNRLRLRKDAEGDRLIALGEELGYEDRWVDLSEFDKDKKDKDGD